MSTANGSSGHGADRVKVLERELAAVTAQRDDLAADVEALCMQQGGSESIFASTSNVLRERILSTQKELNSARVQVRWNLVYTCLYAFTLLSLPVTSCCASVQPSVVRALLLRQCACRRPPYNWLYAALHLHGYSHKAFVTGYLRLCVCAAGECAGGAQLAA